MIRKKPFNSYREMKKYAQKMKSNEHEIVKIGDRDCILCPNNTKFNKLLDVELQKVMDKFIAGFKDINDLKLKRNQEQIVALTRRYMISQIETMLDMDFLDASALNI